MKNAYLVIGILCALYTIADLLGFLPVDLWIRTWEWLFAQDPKPQYYKIVPDSGPHYDPFIAGVLAMLFIFFGLYGRKKA
ncbi:hypothetical protein ACRYJU_00350 [Alloalcanivorax xenomutans]|uniref:hypothetical protein n=1 Tax=Alloalcanivorax xenomutans TaxID=1094342 RepID=UPI003D9BA0C7